MGKRILALMLCSIMFICFAACNKNDAVNNNEVSSNICQSEIADVSELESEVKSDDETSSVQSANSSNVTSTPKEIEKPIEQKKPVFETENIASITFYAYYGAGKGSKVPNENMTEITKWLGSFVVGKATSGFLKPGTNTYYVEIEYSNGKVIKQGLDTVEIDGIGYYMECDSYPDCFMEIMSKTSL